MICLNAEPQLWEMSLRTIVTSSWRMLEWEMLAALERMEGWLVTATL